MERSYVEEHTIFETIIGSQAYGISTPESDVDRSGVMIPGRDYFLGLQKFEQFQGFPGEDRTIYDIRKALGLVADNNPNMLDLLYVPSRCILKMTPYWEKVMDKASLFLSKKARYTFSGYAIAQLSRLKTHRAYLLNPPTHEPTRAEFNLPEEPIFPTAQLKSVCYAAIECIMEEEKPNFFQELDSIYSGYIIPLLARFIREDQRALSMEWLQLGIKSQAKAFLTVGSQYLKDEYLDMAGKEVLYYNATLNWTRYQQWKKSRNKKRAPLEEKFGFDGKHAAHLVRLMRMGMEALDEGKIFVDRTNIDAEELKAIRNGAWSFEQVGQYAKDCDVKLGTLYDSSRLRHTADLAAIHALCVDIVDSYLRTL